MAPKLADGSLRPVLDRCFGLTEIAQAHQYMEANRNFGKIAIAMPD